MTPQSHLTARLLLRGVAGIVIIDAILFGVAGRLDWRAAWVMSGLFAAYVAAESRGCCGEILIVAGVDTRGDHRGPAGDSHLVRRPHAEA